MRVAFFGDVVGKPGRQVVQDRLPDLKARLGLDFCVVNAENAAGGFGLSEALAGSFFAAGADCLTLGDHAWDQRDMLTAIEREPRILRPMNYPPAAQAPGRGLQLFTLPDGRRVGVVQVQGNVFMRQNLACPFEALDTALSDLALGVSADAILVDIHCEATSEKMAIGHHCDGRASLVVGSHTHVPTGDAMVLAGGTAYQSDAGMCGDYDSVIGMRKDISVHRFETQLPGERYQPATGEGTLCGVIADLDPVSGLARRVSPVRLGGHLAETCPDA